MDVNEELKFFWGVRWGGGSGWWGGGGGQGGCERNVRGRTVIRKSIFSRSRPV